MLCYFYYTEERPERPNYGPAAPIDISDAAINQLLDKKMLPQNTFANSMILGSTSELTPEINRIYPSEKSADVQAAQSYRYEELSSKELPVFLNNCK